MNLDSTIQLFQKSKTMDEMSHTAHLMALSLAIGSEQERHELISTTQRQSWIRPILAIAEIDNFERVSEHTKHILESFVRLTELSTHPEAQQLAESFAIEELMVLDMHWVVRTFLAQYLRCASVVPGTLPVNLSWIRTSAAINILAKSASPNIVERFRKHPWWIWILENGKEDIEPVHFTKEQHNLD